MSRNIGVKGCETDCISSMKYYKHLTYLRTGLLCPLLVYVVEYDIVSDVPGDPRETVVVPVHLACVKPKELTDWSVINSDVDLFS